MCLHRSARNLVHLSKQPGLSNTDLFCILSALVTLKNGLSVHRPEMLRCRDSDRPMTSDCLQFGSLYALVFSENFLTCKYVIFSWALFPCHLFPLLSSQALLLFLLYLFPCLSTLFMPHVLPSAMILLWVHQRGSSQEIHLPLQHVKKVGYVIDLCIFLVHRLVILGTALSTRDSKLNKA